VIGVVRSVLPILSFSNYRARNCRSAQVDHIERISWRRSEWSTFSVHGCGSTECRAMARICLGMMGRHLSTGPAVVSRLGSLGDLVAVRAAVSGGVCAHHRR
jgi:hypothetical protein